jgi:hypothetical protein
VQITERAVDLYIAMGKLRCTCAPPSPTRSLCPGCARWYDLHGDLHVELGCRPWQWPCVTRQTAKGAGPLGMDERIAGTMTALREAVRRRASGSAA